jgi:hypothetical protein
MIEIVHVIRRRALGVIVAGLGVLPFAVAARADVIFDFSGTCVLNCSGTATGLLDLTNAYVFGSDITAADFVSFSYTSSALNFTIPAANSATLMGGLNANGSIDSTGLIAILASGGPLFADVGGVFVANPGGSITDDDVGFSSTFTPAGTTVGDPAATPLPAALPLFATGLGGLGLLGWRRKRKSRVSLLGTA